MSEAPKKASFGLTRVWIRNFRCIRDLTLDLDDLTVLIGENNSGKTAVLKAIELGLFPPRGPGGRVFHEYDYRLADDEASLEQSDPITIQFHFEERDGSPWPQAVTEILNRVKILTLGLDERPQVILRVSSSFTESSAPGQATHEFLDHTGQVLGGGSAQPRQLHALRAVVPVASLAALRSAHSEFSSRGRYWRDFLSIRDLPEEARTNFEKGSATLNQALVDAHAPLSKVRDQLARVDDILDFGRKASVTVDALPGRAFAALSRSEVSISAHRGAKIPLVRQGEGTQSLAVLLLFHAHLRSHLDSARSVAHPLTLIEEPEAHLHPAAVRTLRRQVDRLPGQKILSTHSGDFLAAVSPASIRRLEAHRGTVRAGRVPYTSLKSNQKRQFRSHIRHSHGRLLFSRCWLIVEGETDRILFEGVSEALGTPLEQEGVHCVESARTSPDILVTVANQLRIDWLAVFDDDSRGRRYRKAVSRACDPETLQSCVVLPYESPEIFLCQHDFGDVYQKAMRTGYRVNAASETLEYWRQVVEGRAKRRHSKPDLAAQAVQRMIDGSRVVPRKLARIVRRAIAPAQMS